MIVIFVSTYIIHPQLSKNRKMSDRIERILELIVRHQQEAETLKVRELKALQRCEQRLAFLQNAKGVLLARARYDFSSGDPVVMISELAATLFESEGRLRASLVDLFCAQRLGILSDAEGSYRAILASERDLFLKKISGIHHDLANPQRTDRRNKVGGRLPPSTSPAPRTTLSVSAQNSQSQDRRRQLLQRLVEELRQWQSHARAEVERCECVAFRNLTQQERTSNIVCSVWQGGVSPYAAAQSSSMARPPPGVGGASSLSQSPAVRGPGSGGAASPWSFYPSVPQSPPQPLLPISVSIAGPKRLSYDMWGHNE